MTYPLRHAIEPTSSDWALFASLEKDEATSRGALLAFLTSIVLTLIDARTPNSKKQLIHQTKKTTEAAPEDSLTPVYKVGPVEIPNLGFPPGLPCMLGGSLLARDWM